MRGEEEESGVENKKSAPQCAFDVLLLDQQVLIIGVFTQPTHHIPYYGSEQSQGLSLRTYSESNRQDLKKSLCLNVTVYRHTLTTPIVS